jgi:hypothetical protein
MLEELAKSQEEKSWLAFYAKKQGSWSRERPELAFSFRVLLRSIEGKICA